MRKDELEHRLHHGVAEQPAATEFGEDVADYLTRSPRQLPSRYLYDALGSALFDAICQLPWYAITRAEMRLLQKHGHEILTRLGTVSSIVELGSGSGAKLRMLLDLDSAPAYPLEIHLIDVSEAALTAAAHILASLEHVEVVTHQASYEKGLQRSAHARRGGRRLALFLGSNIGNFDSPGANALIRAIRGALVPGDALLLGTDLIKPERQLLLAYDDPLGVTAAFNRNLLVRINRELGGDFTLDEFEHRAVWNGDHSRVEMHLVARRAQRVRIPAAALDIEIAAGEPIWTESSYKFRAQDVVSLLERTGFRQVDQWIDNADQFALTLVQAA
jgi:L-histidine N-alpha-methyltransferase